MKTNLYVLILALSFFSVRLFGQCTVTITSITVSGNSIAVTANGIGNANGAYLWDWDDSTMTGMGTPAYHTYAEYGGYQVCVTYMDSVNPFNCIAADCDSVYIVPMSGVLPKEAVRADVRVTPNPFSDAAHITITLNQQSNVLIEVYDMTGNKVTEIFNDQLLPGTHILAWKPQELAEGIYFLHVTAGEQMQTHKIIHSGAK